MRLLILIASIGLIGCADDPVRDDGMSVDPDGDHYQYVINTIQLPTTISESQESAIDLDDDGRPDNALGSIFATLVSSGIVDSNDKVTEALATGKMLHLVDVQTTSLDNAGGVGVLVFLGDDGDNDPTDNFLGGERFNVRLADVTRTLVGVLNGGQLTAGPGQMPVELLLPGVPEPFAVHLEGARFQVSVDMDQMQGTLAGAIREEDIETVVIPVIHAGVAISVAEDCVGTVCDQNSNGDIFLQLFDDNNDGNVSLEELQSSSLIRGLFAPDVDLFNGSDSDIFAPGEDGVADSLSIGFRFTAVPASFPLPI